jgi:hypothetical protein
MPGRITVTRLRISHVAAHIHDSLDTIGAPVAFARRMASLEPVGGLPVSLPFGDQLPTDTAFWSRIAERELAVPVSQDVAPKLRRAGVPLRCRGTLAVDAEVPRLEAHLHPFGVVAMTTVDLRWPEPVTLDEVWQPVRQLAGQPATVTLGTRRRTTTLGQAAADATEELTALLSRPGRGSSWDLPPYQISTVISSATDQPMTAMPVANSPLHLALHRLSGGDEVFAEPASAFVAQWSGAGYTWPASNLLYLLDHGLSLLSAAAASPAPAPTAAERHRTLLLLVAYLTAAVGLVRAARSSRSELVREWAATAAKRLGMLFGPGRGFLDWGLVPRALMLRAGASEDVAQVLGAPLTANADYPTPAYL